MPAPPLENTAASNGALTLEFRGTAVEYFRIWVVNLCLTLLSLGLFSAWAKVRKKRYIYSHTVLDGTPFQYLGQPLPILKGRLLAAALVAVYYMGGNVWPAIMPFVLSAAVVLAPWVLARGCAFNARYSAYRNMTFAFDGDYVSALVTLYWLGLIPAAVIGTIFQWWGDMRIGGVAFAVLALLFPFWMLRLKRFTVSHTSFGDERAELQVKGRTFYRIYFVGGLFLGVSGALGALLAARMEQRAATIVSMGLFYLGYAASFAYVRAHTINVMWNNATLGPLRFAASLRAWPLLRIYVVNALAIACSLGLLIPWAVIRTLKYRIEHMAVHLDGPVERLRAQSGAQVSAAGAEMAELFELDFSL